MKYIYKLLYAFVLSFVLMGSVGLVNAKVEAQTSPQPPLIPHFQRSWGGLDKWYAVTPVRETYHARNPQADPGPVFDGWWPDGNFQDWLPLNWKPDYRFFGNTRDFGFSQAERFLYKFPNSGAIKFLADASGKSVQKRAKIIVTAPSDGNYQFKSWAWFSQYNGEIIHECGGNVGQDFARNVHLAMEVAVNDVHISEPNVKCPVKNTWQELQKTLALKKNDKVQITLIADQKNSFSGSLFDAYFTLPEGGTGVKL